MNFFKIASGILVATVVLVFSLTRLVFEVIGASTAPDDFALLKQRMPRLLEWLFTTPWIVPTLLVLGATGLATWLLWSGLRGSAFQPMGDNPQLLTVNDVERIIETRLPEMAEAASHPTRNVIAAQLAETSRKIQEIGDRSESGVKDVGNILGLRFNQLSDRMDSIAKACAELEQKAAADLESFRRETRDAYDALARVLRERFDNVDAGFAAISHLEWARRIFLELEAKGRELLASSDAIDSIQASIAWLNSADSWRTDLDQWLMIVEGYAPGTTDQVRSTKGDLSGIAHNRFFDGAGIRTYQDFVIQFENLKRARGRVEKRIHQAAFIRPSMRGGDVDLGPTTN